MKLRIVALLLLTVFASLARANDPYSEEVRCLIGEAEKVPDRDGKVAYLRKAIRAKGDDPGNLFLEKEIAGYLSQYWDPEDPQPLLYEEALKVYESIVSKYDYGAYYEPFGDDRSCLKKGQYAIIQAAIEAGCIYIYERDEGEKGREYLYHAMEMLRNTMERRTKDWLNEPKPRPPAEAVELDVFGEDRGIYEYHLEQWKERQELAKKGDVLFDYEKRTAKTAVKYYGLSYGPQDASMVPLAMGKILKDFPGTPMAEFAQHHIDQAMKIMQGRAEKGMDNALPDLELYPDFKAQAQEMELGGLEAKSTETMVGADPRPPAGDQSDLEKRQTPAQSRMWTYLAAAILITAGAVAWAWKMRKGKQAEMRGNKVA